MNTTAYSLMTHDAKVQTRIAFSDRRNRLIADWAEAFSPESRTFWAECLMNLNDAMLAMGFADWAA